MIPHFIKIHYIDLEDRDGQTCPSPHLLCLRNEYNNIYTVDDGNSISTFIIIFKQSITAVLILLPYLWTLYKFPV